MQMCERMTPQVLRDSPQNPSSVSPGKPTITSDPIEACGIRLLMCSMTPR